MRSRLYRHDVKWVPLVWSKRRVREQAVPVVRVVRVVQSARAGAVRTAPGNHIDVAARWLQQRRCHIDVVRRGGRRAACGGR